MWTYLTIATLVFSCTSGNDSHTYREMSSCPESSGLHVYAHPKHCNQFYKCVNGTLTVETCENGLLFDGRGSVHNHCNYYWAVTCGDRVHEMVPTNPSPFCEYAYGIFKASDECSSSFYRCADGVAEEVSCETGLAFDENARSCNWPDALSGCNSEVLVGFRCPDLSSIPANSLTRSFLPYPRYPVPGDCTHYITCVNNHPRLMTCEDDLVFSDATLTCDEPQNVPQCSKYYKN